MNIIIIIVDSLRQDHVGAYGNDWIRTPHLDAFAKESVRFTRCYPESMPTLQFRKAIHTGKRVFPYKGYKPPKGDLGPAPGWGPIPEGQETLSQLLAKHHYRSALITDCYHQFKANFQQGFDTYDWIRGQEADRFRSGPVIPDNDLDKHINDRARDHQALRHFLRLCLQNSADRRTEEDYFVAKVFRSAADWLSNNQDAERLFMVVDSFDPHEPWDPPVYYRKMYDPEDDVVDLIQSPYAPWKDAMNKRELKRIQANYAGEVTMTDRWFGHFMETLRVTGRLKDTVVAVMSDHGHNLGYDPGDKGFVGKHGHYLTRSVGDLVMMIRHPTGEGAGHVCDKLMYNIDIIRTLLGLAGIEPAPTMEGIDVWPAILDPDLTVRDALVLGWGPNITVIKDNWWYNANIFGEGATLHALDRDPDLVNNIADQHVGICEQLLDLAVKEVGEEIPDQFRAFAKQPNAKLYRFGNEGDIYVTTVPLSTFK